MWHSGFLIALLFTCIGEVEPFQSYVDQFISQPTSRLEGTLILDGTIVDLGKPQEVCIVSLPQDVTFRVNRVLWGEWPNPTIQVGYGGCRISLPSPPFTKGTRLIVFARVQRMPNANFLVRGNVKNVIGQEVRWGLFPATEENMRTALQAIASRPAQRR
jgi:hypothetical protein